MIKGEVWINQVEELSFMVILVVGYNKVFDYELLVVFSLNLFNSMVICLYLLLCLFEVIVVSVGRGIVWLFQVIGYNEVVFGDFIFIL